jgi:hypothetical protein
MKIYYALVYTGDWGLPPPVTGAKPVYESQADGNIPPDGVNLDAPPGVYWVKMAVSQQPNPPKLSGPTGTLICQIGGVRDKDTVVLTEDFRFEVQT